MTPEERADTPEGRALQLAAMVATLRRRTMGRSLDPYTAGYNDALTEIAEALNEWARQGVPVA